VSPTDVEEVGEGEWLVACPESRTLLSVYLRGADAEDNSGTSSGDSIVFSDEEGEGEESGAGPVAGWAVTPLLGHDDLGRFEPTDAHVVPGVGLLVPGYAPCVASVTVRGW
jgi:hypothetical protein